LGGFHLLSAVRFGLEPSPAPSEHLLTLDFQLSFERGFTFSFELRLLLRFELGPSVSFDGLVASLLLELQSGWRRLAYRALARPEHRGRD
jgi:hypothetical protein